MPQVGQKFPLLGVTYAASGGNRYAIILSWLNYREMKVLEKAHLDLLSCLQFHLLLRRSRSSHDP
jgi:hypothetical protein